MKKWIGIIAAFALTANICGCAKKPQKEESAVNIIRDFETFEQIQCGMSVCEYFGKWDLNTDAKYITHGQGSLKLIPTGNYRVDDVGKPFVRISPESHADYSFTADFRKVKSVAFDIYNDSDEEKNLTVQFSYLTDRAAWGTPFTVEDDEIRYELKANAWNNIEIKYDMTRLIKKYPIDKLHHIDLIFDTVQKNEQAGVFYLDNIVLNTSPYEKFIDFGLPQSVTKGAVVKLNSSVKDFTGKGTAAEIEYEVSDGTEKILLEDNAFKAEADRYTIKATAKENGFVTAENEYVLATREKQEYAMIDDLNDYADSTSIVTKTRRGALDFNAAFDRADGKKGALKFTQLREEAGLGFSYKDFMAFKDSIQSFNVKMYYKTAKEMSKVPVFKGLFVNDAAEYLMYKSSAGTWAHEYDVNTWVDVSFEMSELQKIIDEQNNNPDEASRPFDYPEIYLGFNSLNTDDKEAEIYFADYSITLKELSGTANTAISLDLPSLNTEGFKCSIKSVKNKSGLALPYDAKNKTFTGNSGEYEIAYTLTGNTIKNSTFVRKLIINNK